MTNISFEQIPAVCEQLLQGRRHDDALKVVKTFVEHGAPHYPALKSTLLNAEQAGKTGAVDAALDAVRKRFPGDVRTWWLDARVQQFRHAWPNLLSVLEQVEECGDSSGEVALWRGRAYLRMARGEDAIDALDAADPHGGTPGEYCHLRASALLLLGRHEEAIALLRSYLENPADNMFAAGCWKVLGKALDRESAYEEAFDAFTRGNQVADKLYNTAIEQNPLRQRIGAFRQLMEPDWCARWSADYGAPSTAESPVFLIGFPRSGTTLLEQVLDAHPRVLGLEERPLVEAVWDQVPSLLEGPDRELSDPVERQASELRSLADLSPSSLAALRETYRNTRAGYLDWPEGTVLVDKLPLNLSSLPLILRLFPRARFIVALRHPCDCILSNYMQDFAMNPGMHFMVDLERAAWLYREMFALLEQSRQALNLEQQLHFIRYEDLVSDFEASVSTLLEFLGVDWDASVSRYHEHAQQRGTLGTPSYEGVTRELYSGSIGRWRRYADHLPTILPYLSDAASRFGYELHRDARV
jgi:tetratricopeptide (TPR) repeat protein